MMYDLKNNIRHLGVGRQQCAETLTPFNAIHYYLMIRQLSIKI
jgi:hypothetical protein